MTTLKKIRSQGQKELEFISSSRYISPMLKNGNNGYSHISLDYAGSHGALFRADCLQLLANIRENTIDLVYVDPPFNLNKDYAVSEFDDNMETEAYRSWCRAWLLELTRVLKPGGALFLYHWPKWLIDLGAWLVENYH